jgi:hypothetical protein
MKGAYEKKELAISQDEFLIPEVVTIPLECEEYDLNNNPNTPTKLKADLDQLGF